MLAGSRNLEKLFRTVNKLFYGVGNARFLCDYVFLRITSMQLEGSVCQLRTLPGILVRADGTCDELGSTATVLGMFENWNCTVGEAATVVRRHLVGVFRRGD